MVEIIIDLILAKSLRLFISADLSKELFKKLHYFKAGELILEKTTIVLASCFLVKPNIQIKVYRDPKDNFLLELAESVDADYLITRDKDLLDLTKQWKKTTIIKPEEFMQILRQASLI